jgi:hypothetical protein
VRNYICEPADLLVGGLRNVPLVLGSVGDCLQLIVDLPSELGLVMSIPEFLLVVDSLDGLALVSHLHEQVGVIIGFLGVEINVGWTVDLELFIDFLSHCLLPQALTVNSHFLNQAISTETGSLTFGPLSAPLSLPPTISIKYNLI